MPRYNKLRWTNPDEITQPGASQIIWQKATERLLNHEHIPQQAKANMHTVIDMARFIRANMKPIAYVVDALSQAITPDADGQPAYFVWQFATSTGARLFQAWCTQYLNNNQQNTIVLDNNSAILPANHQKQLYSSHEKSCQPLIIAYKHQLTRHLEQQAWQQAHAALQAYHTYIGSSPVTPPYKHALEQPGQLERFEHTATQVQLGHAGMVQWCFSDRNQAQKFLSWCQKQIALQFLDIDRARISPLPYQQGHYLVRLSPYQHQTLYILANKSICEPLQRRFQHLIADYCEQQKWQQAANLMLHYTDYAGIHYAQNYIEQLIEQQFQCFNQQAAYIKSDPDSGLIHWYFAQSWQGNSQAQAFRNGAKMSKTCQYTVLVISKTHWA